MSAHVSAPVSLEAVAPRFVPGEQLTWEVTYKGIEGGRARMAIGEPATVDGRAIVAVRTEAESSGLLAVVKTVRDETSAWIDAESALPVRTRVEANTSGRQLKVETVFDHASRRAELEVTVNGKLKKVGRRLPDGETYDPLSTILLLRGWEAPVGARTTLHTLGGKTMWRTELAVEARETIGSGLGDVATIRLSGTSVRIGESGAVDTRKPPRRFTVWMTDDARRVPVKIRAHTELGDLDVTATSWDAPVAAR